MKTHANNTPGNKSQSVANEVSQKKAGSESTFQFVDNRPEAIAQRKLQETANNSPKVKQLRVFQEIANNSPQAKQGAHSQEVADSHSEQKQQQPIQKSNDKTCPVKRLKLSLLDAMKPRQSQGLTESSENTPNTTIQLVNRLTMHPHPLDTRLAGGGKGSSINTGAEVQAVIKSGNLQDLKDSHKALKLSINVRKASLNPDVGHKSRIAQEENWLKLLETAITPIEEKQQASRSAMLRGPAPAMGPEKGFHPGPGPVWGGAAVRPIGPPELEGVTTVTEEIVREAIRDDKTEVLECLFRSPRFPLSVWEPGAWSIFMDWNAGVMPRQAE